MLVLTRKTNESIVISIPGVPEPITVMVVEIRHGNMVRLGIQAPKEISVHRREVQDAIQREGKRRRA
jgi:carbon storage regulator